MLDPGKTMGVIADLVHQIHEDPPRRKADLQAKLKVVRAFADAGVIAEEQRGRWDRRLQGVLRAVAESEPYARAGTLKVCTWCALETDAQKYQPDHNTGCAWFDAVALVKMLDLKEQ